MFRPGVLALVLVLLVSITGCHQQFVYVVMPPPGYPNQPPNVFQGPAPGSPGAPSFNMPRPYRYEEQLSDLTSATGSDVRRVNAIATNLISDGPSQTMPASTPNVYAERIREAKRRSREPGRLPAMNNDEMVEIQLATHISAAESRSKTNVSSPASKEARQIKQPSSQLVDILDGPRR